MMSRVVVILGALAMALSARAADLKLEAKLIWGSNDPTNKVNHKLVEDPKLSADLHRIFKWANYYEIYTKSASIPHNKNDVLQMSDKCKLDVKNLGNNWIEVSCIGKGKQVSHGKHSVAPGQWLTLGGNDTNNSAWFVVMRNTSGGVQPTPVTKAH